MKTGSPFRRTKNFLFVRYGAFHFSGIVLFGLPRAAGGCRGNRILPTRCAHPWLDHVIGPVGEPSLASRSDGRYLYFVYAKVKDNHDPSGIPDLDFQAGYVLER